MTIFRTGVAIAALMITVPDWSGDVPLATSPDWFGNVPRATSPAAAQAPAGVSAEARVNKCFCYPPVYPA